MTNKNPKIQKILNLQKETALLKSTLSLLHWDQETFLPQKSVDWRSQQIAQLSGLIHDRETSEQWGELFQELQVNREKPQGAATSLEEKSLLRLSWREYNQATCFPRDYIVEKSALLSQSQAAWIEARKKNDFTLFQPWLEKVVDFSKRDADYLGYNDHPYDALLDLYEPGMKTAEVKALFDPLGEKLSALVTKIGEQEGVDNSFLQRSLDPKIQEQIGLKILKEMGYDFDRGRQDVSAHPFTIELGPDDFRVTTHYAEDRFALSFYGTIHEGGHALYEMGINPDYAGTPLGQGVSLGIHESQSRYWENLICRSQAFCQYSLPWLQEMAPSLFKGIDEQSFYRAINRVQPSLIRIEADEVTYSLHIILRFNLERALLEGKLKVSELPEAWRAESEKLLGITPDSDASGVLQDTHWAGGAFGYFPTYALGNLYGAQFLNKMGKDLPEWEKNIKAGDFASILQWLKKSIHSKGSLLPAADLCKEVCGEALNPQYFIDYLYKKYSGIYSL